MYHELTDLGCLRVRVGCVSYRTVAGNELASSLVEEEYDEELPRGAVVNFTFPADFLSQLRDLSYM